MKLNLWAGATNVNPQQQYPSAFCVPPQYPEGMRPLERRALSAIVALRDDASTLRIHEKLALASLGRVYFALDRLEDKGLVSSWLAVGTEARGGRRRRFYRVEAIAERTEETVAESLARALDRLKEALGSGRAREWGK